MLLHIIPVFLYSDLANSAALPVLQLLHGNAPWHIRKARIYSPIQTAASAFQCSPNIGLLVRVSRGKQTQQCNLPLWDRNLAVGTSLGLFPVLSLSCGETLLLWRQIRKTPNAQQLSEGTACDIVNIASLLGWRGSQLPPVKAGFGIGQRTVQKAVFCVTSLAS